ncbi:PepSY-associated TM helix domain-containing protein [Fodinibius halophilus]|uniref:PepSY domain-containing protein n=1 Tax=Fodinibius halophilus TaxID=1736908 RepID=A0A6M1T295_9BACT|nr:PepSY-associated TM helix domain-containing protein [Fodinibius halophilus]NGP88127.1 PepSY domain-containing protein [Fodinibius halophilus]
MGFDLRKDSRKLHRWGAILIALPFLIVLISGLFLQVKKEFDWIQPATQSGSQVGASLPFDSILNTAKSIPKLAVNEWEDIDRLDVRPDDGIIKIRSTNGWEAQIDAHTGEKLQLAKRRSDVIEAIHDGSWFHDEAKLWLFLPSAVVVLILWLTGIYLFFYPYFAKWQNRKRLKERKLEKRRKERQKEKEMAL